MNLVCRLVAHLVGILPVDGFVGVAIFTLPLFCSLELLFFAMFRGDPRVKVHLFICARGGSVPAAIGAISTCVDNSLFETETERSDWASCLGFALRLLSLLAIDKG